MIAEETKSGGLELDYADEEAFMGSFLSHVDERLNAGEMDIPVNLAGIVSLPKPYLEALEAAVMATEGAGARLWFFVTQEFAELIEKRGKSETIPHEIIDAEVLDVPLEEQHSSFELMDDWLISRAPDETELLRQFQENFELMLVECPRVQIDLRSMPHLSQRFCKSLVLAAIQAREMNKEIELRVTRSQQKVLQKLPGAEFFEMSREAQPANTQRVKRLSVASKRLKAVMRTGRDKRASEVSDNRREHIRLRVSNAFLLYRLQSSQNKLKTRVVDLSESGLSFFASEMIEVNTKISIYLETPAFMEPPKIRGKVVRCEKVQLKSGLTAFKVGVQFGELPEDVGSGLRNTLAQKK